MLVTQENWDVQTTGGAVTCALETVLWVMMGEGGKSGFADSAANVTL